MLGDSLAAEIGTANIADDGQPDWNKTVSVLECHVIIGTKAEFLTSTAAFVLLTYDLIRQCGAVLSQVDQDFFSNIFSTFVVDKKMLAAIKKAVDDEANNCAEVDTDLAKANALFVLESLLSETSISLSEQSGSETSSSATSSCEDTNNTKVSATLSTQAVYLRDVQVQYFLKPGCTLEVNHITSVDAVREMLVV